MTQEDVLIQADIDLQVVNSKLGDTEKRVADLAKRGGSAMEDLSKEVEAGLGSLQRAADLAVASGDKVGSAFFKGKKDISEIRTLVEKLAGDLKKIQTGLPEADISRSLNIQQANQRMKQLRDTTQQMLDSTDDAAQRAGNTLRQAGVQATVAFRKGEMSAEEFNKEIRKINTQANQMGREFGTNVSGGVDRSQVSVWKLGRAMDRVGVRGAGAALNIVDAFRGIDPVMVGAALGAAAVVVAIQKIGSAAIKAGKKITKAFVDAIKKSTETAEEFEVIETQLINLFEGKEKLAKATLDKILDISADFGVDLTGEIAQTFLPLVESMEQFREVGQIAATLIQRTGATQEEVNRAMKQAQAGRFRSLQDQFGLIATDIERIKVLQEELGATEGLIVGMQRFFDRTGEEWDTYEETLRRVRGTLKVLQKQAELALGEPVKNQVAEELEDLLDLIEENKDEIEAFLAGVGDAVAAFIETAGDTLEGFFGDIDADSLQEVVNALDEFLTSLGGLGGQVLPEEGFDSVLNIAITILNTLDAIVTETRVWAAVLKEVSGYLPEATNTERLTAFLKIRDFTNKFFGLGITPGSLSLFETDPGRSLEEIIQEEKRALEARIDARERDAEAAKNQASATDEAIDATLAEIQAEQEFLKLQEDAIAAQKEVTEERRKLEIDLARDLEDLWTDYQRKTIDLEIDGAEKRADIQRKYWQNVRDINIKHRARVRESNIDFDEKEEDLLRKHGDSITDLEIETAKKIEEIERKHRDRLLDIRQRFDFQAQEAIRMNDAVRLLQIRRRMEFELKEEKERRDDAVDDAERAAKDKRAALKRQLDRELRDLEINNKRKLEELQRRLEDEIKMESQKRTDALKQQKIDEKRRVEELQRWLDQELKDFNTAMKRKLDDLRDKYQDELAIIDQYEQQKAQRLQQWAIKQAKAVAKAIKGIMGGDLGGILDLFGGIGDTGGGNGSGGIGGRDDGESEMEELKSLALSLAKQLDRDDLVSIIDEMTDVAKLRDLIFDLQDQLSGKALGGFVQAGQPYMTGELGPEPFIPTRAGIVARHEPFMMPSSALMGGPRSVDMSRSVSADMSLLDPTHLTPIQKTMIRNIVTEEILKAEQV